MNLFIFIMFVPTLAAICWGIWHEDKLVRFERALWVGILMTVRDWAEDKLARQRVEDRRRVYGKM